MLTSISLDKKPKWYEKETSSGIMKKGFLVRQANSIALMDEEDVTIKLTSISLDEK